MTSLDAIACCQHHGTSEAACSTSGSEGAWVQVRLCHTGSWTTHLARLKSGGTKASLTDQVSPNCHTEYVMGVRQAGREGILRDHTKSRPGLFPWAAHQNCLEALKQPLCPGPMGTGPQRGMVLPWCPGHLVLSTQAVKARRNQRIILAGCPGVLSEHGSVFLRAQLQAVELLGLR